RWGFIKDPLYGYVAITPLEKDIIDTRVVQRLRRLRQLAGAEFVYPGANHTRFEHSVGAMHLAGLMADNITEDETEIQALRLAALLHDVGHGPFSHIFEEILAKKDQNHEDITSWLIRNSEIADIIRAGGFNPDELSRLAIGKLEKKERLFLNQVIRSSVDVDKLDYIVRDSFHTGAEYGNVDVFRLIYTTEPFQRNLAVNTTALTTLESFLIARVLSFRSIYYHRVCRGIQRMLADALKLADEELGLSEFDAPEDYLDMDDYTTWSGLKQCKASRPVIERLERRELLKCAYTVESIVQDHPTIDLLDKASVRKQIEEEIAIKAKVDPGKVQLDSPLLPSVPYRHSSLLDPMEIPGFAYVGKKKIAVDLVELSRVISSLKGYLDIVRVYTTATLRKRVGKASQEVLGGTPYVSGISM
ncbi:MAG: HD domain-containing protein, partial [Candidatus Thorarchaeota archaeon]